MTDPDAVGALMRGFHAPWCVAAGWALDLFLGSSGWTFEKVPGGVLKR